jgi:ankyrin repeat protein
VSIAAQECHKDSIRVLIELGAEINNSVYDGSPVFMAGENENVDAVILLIKSGADLT